MIEKNLFFNYEEIQLETSKKKKSLLISPKDLFESFVKSSLKNFNSNDIEDINFFFL